MIKWILMTLLVGVFLAGYYVGHLPGSPDLFAWTGGWYKHARGAGEKISSAADQIKDEFGVSSEPSGEMIVKVGGKLYRIGKVDGAEKSPR